MLDYQAVAHRPIIMCSLQSKLTFTRLYYPVNGVYDT